MIEGKVFCARVAPADITGGGGGVGVGWVLAATWMVAAAAAVAHKPIQPYQS